MLVRLASATACALALTVVGSTTAAQAASRTFVDGPGDVWRFNGVASSTRVPDRAQGDILRMTFTHGQRQVVVRTRFAQLNHRGDMFSLSVLRTNTGLVRNLFLEAGRGVRGGRTFLRTNRGVPIDCAIRHDINYATNVTVVRVPRTCLNNPRTVQASFYVVTSSRGDDFLDNPINHGPTRHLPPYTSPVRRG